MATQIWAHNGQEKGVLPNGTKPMNADVLIKYHQNNILRNYPVRIRKVDLQSSWLHVPRHQRPQNMFNATASTKHFDVLSFCQTSFELGDEIERYYDNRWVNSISLQILSKTMVYFTAK